MLPFTFIVPLLLAATLSLSAPLNVTETSVLLTRSGKALQRHPSGKDSDATLWHGSRPPAPGQPASILDNGPPTTLMKYPGELSPDGGFYLTDEKHNAGVWGCHGQKAAAKVVIYEYKWSGVGLEVLEHEDPEWNPKSEYFEFIDFNFAHKHTHTVTDAQKNHFKQITAKYHMITGPLNPTTPQVMPLDFHQYAIVKSEGLKNLKLVKKHEEDCSKYQGHP